MGPRMLGLSPRRAVPCRAAPERLGFAAWRPTCPWPGANPPQCQASHVSCAHGAACRGSCGAGDQGTPAGRAASLAPGRRGAGRASGMERRHGGSRRAGMACIPAAAPTPGDDARWLGSGALAGGQEPRGRVMGRTTHWCVHGAAEEPLSRQRQSRRLPRGGKA